MKRAEDPRVAKVLAAFDRAAASPHADVLRCSASALVYDCADYLVGWTPAAMRAVLETIALNAPDDELDELAAYAERRLAWVEWYDREGWLAGCMDANGRLDIASLKSACEDDLAYQQRLASQAVA